MLDEATLKALENPRSRPEAIGKSLVEVLQGNAMSRNTPLSQATPNPRA